MNEIRTIEDFVEDMISDGKSLKQILVVAESTRWKNFKKEIKETYQKITGSNE